ncbi:MAG: Spy/CpxP family protein refolding chaperone [Acetobacteraceae bacterium]
MRPSLRLLAALALLGAGGVLAGAVAQPMGPGGGPGMGGMGPGGGPGMGGMGPGGMRGSGPGGMMGGPAQMGEPSGYLDALKLRLGITQQQEPAWTEYAEVVKGNAAQMQAMHQTMYEAMGTATWEERRDMMNRMFESRQQAMTNVHEAAEKLLPALTPNQRQAAQQFLPGLRGPGGMGMGMGRGPR